VPKPVAVRFAAVFGFVDEYGDRWHWESGQIVRNPFVIELLMARAAPVEILRLHPPIEKLGE